MDRLQCLRVHTCSKKMDVMVRTTIYVKLVIFGELEHFTTKAMQLTYIMI